MQFVTNGPHIPDALLQAHEEGRVVFFCGAGISYPAGLTGFEGLVQGLYERVGEPPNQYEKDLIKDCKFDQFLGHYEHRVQGGRSAVRRWLPSVLTPDLTKKRSLTTQLALLKLGRSQRNGLRLVTTNFDILFEKATEAYGIPSVTVYPDPPIRPQWQGIVHLHGRMPENSTEDELNQLVLTDGDFGQAYLTHGWAARFVASLFRESTLCFVGYSINDPVLRYMTAAHALEARNQLFAFAESKDDDEYAVARDWNAKGVTPIIYNKANHHQKLHQSLHLWASIYEDAVMGKERLVSRCVRKKRFDGRPQNELVGQMLWAISDKSGLPAKRFAEINPVPSIEWLFEAFEIPKFDKNDLPRFGVSTYEEFKDKFRFSLVHRPAPVNLSQGLSLVHGGRLDSRCDSVMANLIKWIIRHLNDPRLIVWIANRGGCVHEQLAWSIQKQLDDIRQLENESNKSELEKLRTDSPNAIPCQMMRIVWEMILGGQLKSTKLRLELYTWKERFKRNGLTTTIRKELRELLSPKLVIQSIPLSRNKSPNNQEFMKLSEIVNWELELCSENAREVLRDFSDDRWKEGLPSLLEDFQLLLMDALQILQEVGEADSKRDKSHLGLPSIIPHRQKRETHVWTVLIELVRNAWIELFRKDSESAKGIAISWFQKPFATFKRLAFYAAGQDGCVSSDQWVQWLLMDCSCWLWSIETRREVLRLLVQQGKALVDHDLALLECAILKGPPREQFRADMNTERWNHLHDHSIWLRLAKLNSSGRELGTIASERLSELSVLYPDWQLASNESDEFSTWIYGTGDPEFEDNRNNGFIRQQVEIIPTKRHKIVDYFEKHHSDSNWTGEEDWQARCKRHLMNTLFALKDLGSRGDWNTKRWRIALNVWSQTNRRAWWSWRYAATVTKDIPDLVFKDIVREFSHWLEVVSKSLDRHEALFIDLCRRVLETPMSPDSGMTRNGKPLNQPVTDAINHPVGDVTQALMNLWFSRNPIDNERLPKDIEPLFTFLCNHNEDGFRHGRVLLASRLISFFRVDKEWTERNLLPIFDWAAQPYAAKEVWQGFLWSPRLYSPLMVAMKSSFLQCSQHFQELGDYRDHYAALLTHAALKQLDSYTLEEFRAAFDLLPKEGLEAAARTLVNALESTAEQRVEFWKNRISPFWREIWPKSSDRLTPFIVESLYLLCIAAGPVFPLALNKFKDFLKTSDNAHIILFELKATDICSKFPMDALMMLSVAIDENHSPIRDLRDCLNSIVQSSPKIINDDRFRKLDEICRRASF